MSTEERAALVRALNRSVEALAVAGIRDAYPDATEREAFLRLAIRKLGYATARHVHPEIAHLEGFGR
jgi:hypothetical protein